MGAGTNDPLRERSAHVTALEALLDGTGLPAAVAQSLACYGTLVLEANRRVNLTGAKTPEALAAHLFDSLTVVPYIQEPYVDVGSGGGFPAIPVAIVTGAHPTLIEATAKKARVLQEMLDSLELQGKVVAERAEVAGHSPELRGHFASATARGVAGGSTVAELLLPLLALGGTAILQRGAQDEAERVALEDACLMLGGAIEAEADAGFGRRIVIVRKKRPTASRFPRRTGIPQKRPLCG